MTTYITATYEDDNPNTATILVDGLNIIPETLLFTTPDNICKYFKYWVTHVRLVTLSENTEMITDDWMEPNEWRAKELILGPRKNLSDVSTWIWLHSLNTNFHINNDIVIVWTASYGFLDVVKYLVSIGTDIHALDNSAERLAKLYGHQEIVDYIKSLG
jgi:hypothetical protein